MTEIKLHKNEIEYIKMGVESNAYLGNDEKLAERILKKLNQALTIPVVVKQSEQFNCYEMHAYSRFAGCNKQCKECAVNEKSKAI